MNSSNLSPIRKGIVYVDLADTMPTDENTHTVASAFQ